MILDFEIGHYHQDRHPRVSLKYQDARDYTSNVLKINIIIMIATHDFRLKCYGARDFTS